MAARRTLIATAAAACAALALPGRAAAIATMPIVTDAVGVRVTEAGLNFVEGQLAGFDVDVTRPEISKAGVSCYDTVGVDDLHVTTELESVSLDFIGANASLAATLRFPAIDLTGELFGEDSDFFDLCPSFSAAINLIELTGVVFTAEVAPWVDDANNVHFTLVGDPVLSFDDVSVDVEYVSDTVEDFVFGLEFVQDFVADKLNEQLATQVPPLLAATALSALFTGNQAGLDYVLGVADIAVDDGGGNFTLDVGLSSALPPAECALGAAIPALAGSGAFGLGGALDASMLQASISDALVNQALFVEWATGALCLDETSPSLASFATVLEGLSAGAGEALAYTVEVRSPPTVHIDTGVLTVDLDGFFVEAYSSLGGASTLLFRLDADLTLGASIDLDPNTNQLLLSVDGLTAQFRRLESDILYSDSPSAETDLIAFVTGFVLPRVQAEFASVPISNAIIYAGDYVVLFDTLVAIPAHLVAGLTIFDADDPSLDRTAPETWITGAPLAVEGPDATIAFDGSDDRAGGLVFSWQVDGAGWSTWRGDHAADLTALPEGTHTVRVKARDRFLNEDLTPAVAMIDVRAASDEDVPPPPPAPMGCACRAAGAAGAPAPAPAVLWLVGLALAGALLRPRRGGRR